MTSEPKEKTVTIQEFLMRSLVAGALTAILMAVFSGILYFSGISRWFVLLDSGALTFRTTGIPLTTPTLVLALIAHIYWGSFLVMGLSFFFLLVGKKYYVLHGILYSTFVWLAVRNFFLSLSVPQQGLTSLDSASVVTAMLSHWLWGGVTAFALIKLIPYEENTMSQDTITGRIKGIPFLPAPAYKRLSLKSKNKDGNDKYR